MVPVGVEPLDRNHRPTANIAYGGDAGSVSFSVDMDRASAAQRHTAAVFCSGKTELISQKPQQRHRRIAVKRLLLAVDAQLDHGRFLPVDANDCESIPRMGTQQRAYSGLTQGLLLASTGDIALD